MTGASGKAARDENFPVGSWLIAAALRPHVRAFYAFARAADDVADRPDLTPDRKLARLGAFRDALLGSRDEPVAAVRLRASLAATGVDARHALDLIEAFRQDAVQTRYADWAELMRYCARSASPVGRYLLELHGEDRAHFAASDPLCDALQVLNHLQDCGDDFRRLDRVYLPAAWLAAAGADARGLASPRASPALRAVLDRCLDRTDGLVARARELPLRLRNPRLAAEAAVIVGVAERLSRELRRRDPLAGRVALRGPGFALAALRGLGLAFPRRWRPRPTAAAAP